MIRRTFINKFSSVLSIGALFPFNVLSKNKFKLNYAPHLGMFKNNVGDDPIDQILAAPGQQPTATPGGGDEGQRAP